MDQDQKTRVGGLFLLCSGLALGYLSIWRPYQAAIAGAPSVSLSRMGIGVAILFPLLGAILIVGGEAASNHLKAHATGTKTKRGWVYIAIIAAIALGAYLTVEAKFNSLGYGD